MRAPQRHRPRRIGAPAGFDLDELLLTLLCPRTDDEKSLYLAAFFLIAAFAPKATRKFAETKFQ